MNKKHPVVQSVAGILSVGVFLFYQILAAPKGPGAYYFHFNLYIVLIFIAMIVNLALYIKVIRVKSRRGVVLWFSFVPLLNVLWLIFIAGMFFARQPQVGQYWAHMTPLAWISQPVFILFFVLSYLDDNDLQRGFLLWTAPVVSVISTLYIAGMTGFIQYIRPLDYEWLPWGYDTNLGTNSEISFVWAMGFSFIALALLIRGYKRSKIKLEKRQLRIFIIAISVYLFLILTFDIIFALLPASANHPVPTLAFLYTTLLASIIGYGILKYRIFKVTPAALSGTILQSLTESVVAVNEDLEIQFTNLASDALFGQSQQELKGIQVGQLLPANVFEKVQSGLQAIKGDVARFDDITVINEHKLAVPVELSVGPVYDEHHVVAGYVFVFTNVSELKKKTTELAREKASVEQKVLDRTLELNREHARLTASINSLRVGFLMTGQDDQILTINPTAVRLLKSLADVQKLTVSEEWNLHTIMTFFAGQKDLVALLSDKESQNKSYEFKEVQVKDRFIHVFVSPVTEDGGVMGSVILLEDVTEEKALNRSKDEFFVLASHELRTPLTKINGAAEVIREVYGSAITSESALKMLGEIEHSSAHLINIVSDFIELSELEQRKVVLEPVEFNLSDLATERLHHASADAKEGVKIKLESGDSMLHIIADKNKVTSVLDRMLANAFKFTNTGVVTLNLKKEDASVRITITDTGIGIKHENKSLLFRKFQQAGSSLLTRDSEGTGLGLYIAKLTAKQLGGTVGLQSSDVDAGSVFYFDLPLVQAKNQ